jgi:Domain of unknown function (DUF4157)
MSDHARGDRPSPAPVEVPEQTTPTKVFRSLNPGEIGGDRMNPVYEERAAANAQIQRSLKAWRAANGNAAGEAGVPQTQGSPLPASVRKQMEPKLGADLGGVRVHTGGQSADAAKGFGARAFTVGDDVHFNAGEFRPGTKEGDKLLAHELTHVVQGQKSGVQRSPEKGEEAKGGGEKGGGEVSKPEEPAEKEADAVGDKVGEDLHGGGEKGEKKDEKGGGDKKDKKDGDKKDKKGGDKKGEKGEKEEKGEKGEKKEGGAEGKDGGKEGEAGDKGAGEEGDKGGEKKGEEKAAPIAAKLEGVGFWKIFRAPSNPPPAPAPTISANTGTMTVAPSATRDSDPMSFTESKGKYDGQFDAVKQAVMAAQTDPAKKDVVGKKFEDKRNDWYTRFGNAVLKQDAAAGTAIFPVIEAEAKAMLPDDAPAKDGGHLYSGQAGGEKGRTQAENHAKANPTGGKPGTLETTNMGKLFDGVTGNKPADKWLPWNNTAQAWWSTISASYAKTLRGEINAHVCVGFPYQIKEKFKPKSADNPTGMTKAQAQAKIGDIAAIIKLPDNVFSGPELAQVTQLIEQGLATLKVHLKLEIVPGNCPDTQLDVSSGDARAKIEEKIKTMVTADALLGNFPA